MTTRFKCDVCGSEKLERQFYIWRAENLNDPEAFDIEGAEPTEMGWGDWFCPDCDAEGRDGNAVGPVEYECDSRPEMGTLALYRALHDGLSDMIESGRLSAGDIPDDYHWLVESLATLANR